MVEKSGTLNAYIAGYNWYENIILSLEGLEDTEHTLAVTVNSHDDLFGLGDLWIDE